MSAVETKTVKLLESTERRRLTEVAGRRDLSEFIKVYAGIRERNHDLLQVREEVLLHMLEFDWPQAIEFIVVRTQVSPNLDNYKAIRCAFRNLQLGNLKVLLANGGSVATMNVAKYAARAAKSNDAKMMGFLLSLDKLTGVECERLVRYAAEGDAVDVFKLLMSRGLEYAVNKQVLTAIVKHGSNELLEEALPVLQRNKAMGEQELKARLRELAIEACDAGFYACCKAIIQVFPEAVQSGEALARACDCVPKSIALLRLLVEQGRSNVHYDSDAAIRNLCSHGRRDWSAESISYLLGKGADPNASGVFSAIARNRDISLIKQALARGARWEGVKDRDALKRIRQCMEEGSEDWTEITAKLVLDSLEG